MSVGALLFSYSQPRNSLAENRVYREQIRQRGADSLAAVCGWATS